MSNPSSIQNPYSHRKAGLDIVIPVFNELPILEEFLRRIDSLSLSISKRLIFVDDASTDGSFELIREYSFRSEHTVLRNPKNLGKGSAIRQSLPHITAPLVCIQDADLEYDPKEINELLKPILLNEYDAVYGSRLLRESAYTGGFAHHAANLFLTKFFNIVHQANLTDMETCYKVLRSEDLKNLRLRSNRFGIEPEISAKLLRAHRRILELPITYRARSRKEGKKIGFMDGLAAIYHIIRFRLRD